jgi:DNA-binding response OmpR family regulator/ABC-type transport system involved in multi-copper enzyme maturation permease subunit
MPAVLKIYGWELRKLRAQKRTYLGLGAAAAVPIIFAVALATQSGQPNDVAFGRYLHDNGLAIPLVLLLFGSVWMFPLITALVAGDIVAAEDRHGTLKTILTRSVERHQIFLAKTLATVSYAIVAIATMGAVAVVAGVLVSGFNPIITLSGTKVSASRGLGLVWASLLVYLIPILSIACIGLLFSTLFRNSGAAVVSTLMFSLLVQLIGILPGLGALHPYLLSTQFEAWQGFLRVPVDWAPIVRAIWVCAIYALPALATALIVEDDPPVRRMLERSLHAEGFRVDSAPDGGIALAIAERVAPDLVVLDIGMPGLDGLAVCRRLRAGGMAGGILMLTARDAIADRVDGLEAGADDYVVKPFAIEEVVARLRALARRGRDAGERLRFADLTLDLTARTANRAGREPIELTGREAALLEMLVRNPRVVVSREAAIEEIWSDAAVPNVVDRYVARLRRKLGDPPLIRTVRGIGFTLEE